MTHGEATNDMLDGYLDGLRGAPEPGANRSASYCHGWKNGRDDRRKAPRASSSYIHAEAQAAIAVDLAR